MGRKSNKSSTGLVYSTEAGGRVCPQCGWPASRCACSSAPRGASRPTGDGVVRIERQTKGRKGKGVTLIRGVPLADAELAQLAKRLKKLCGSGGTLKDGVIEIQGDHRDRLLEELGKHPWKVKKAGG